jgi:hypothetical protein
MNERIKLLAEQAGAEYTITKVMFLTGNEIEKFAELIVRESIDWLAMNEEDAKELREHFGVEL